MTPKQFYYSSSRDVVEVVCKGAGTTVPNFKQIVFGGSVGKLLASRLAQSSNGAMSELEILYPERYEQEGSIVNTDTK